MSGLLHITHHHRFQEIRRNFLTLPLLWPLRQEKQAQTTGVARILTENDPLPPSRRLVVILPDADIDLPSLPRRIWKLAAPDGRQVLLMIRPCREGNELNARVDLATLASIIRDPRVNVQTKLVLGMSLDQAVRRSLQPGDVLVCFAEHQVKSFLKKRPLAVVLHQKTRRPVYTLEGAVSEMDDPISTRLIDFLRLAACGVSLVAFFALQVWIDRNAAGTIHTILQMLAVIVEVGSIGWLSGIQG